MDRPRRTNGRRTLREGLDVCDRPVGPNLGPLREVHPRVDAFAVFVYQPGCVYHPDGVVGERDALVQGPEMGRVAFNCVLGELVFL